MNIELFNYRSTENKESQMGLNISSYNGRDCVSMFVIDDNEGTAICENFWTAARAVLEEKLPNQNFENVEWRHIVGDRINRIQFETLNDQPLKLTMSDLHAVQQELCAFDTDGNALKNGFARPIDEYEERYKEAELQESKKHAQAQVVRYPENEYSVYQVPCNDSRAKDGVISCKPPYMDADHMKDDYEVVLVQTHKLFNAFKKDDPNMYAHMSAKTCDVDRLFDQVTLLDNPLDTGNWGCSSDDDITFHSGDPAIVAKVNTLDVPYFPVTLRKGYEASVIRDVAGINTPSKSKNLHMVEGMDQPYIDVDNTPS